MSVDRTPDIFAFWARIRPEARTHPADEQVFSRIGNPGFDLRCLPAAYSGPLKTARVVLLYLSPGFSDFDLAEAESPEGQERYVRRRKGTAPLPSKEEHESAWRWWSSRTRCFGHWEELRDQIAVLNIGAYHSRKFTDWGLLAALPSSRMSIAWAQNVLFPEALAGKRVVVCLRAGRYWGLDVGRHYPVGLYSPPVTVGGHMYHGAMREEIIKAVKAALR
jgi:hypothetical protein